RGAAPADQRRGRRVAALVLPGGAGEPLLQAESFQRAIRAGTEQRTFQDGGAQRGGAEVGARLLVVGQAWGSLRPEARAPPAPIAAAGGSCAGAGARSAGGSDHPGPPIGWNRIEPLTPIIESPKRSAQPFPRG